MNVVVRLGDPGNPGAQVFRQDSFSEAFLPNTGDSMMIDKAQHAVTHRIFGYDPNGVYTAELFVG